MLSETIAQPLYALEGGLSPVKYVCMCLPTLTPIYEAHPAANLVFILTQLSGLAGSQGSRQSRYPREKDPTTAPVHPGWSMDATMRQRWTHNRAGCKTATLVGLDKAPDL